MSRILLIMSLVFLFNNASQAQRKAPKLDTQKEDEQKKANEIYGNDDSWKDKIFFGGNVGGSFGTYGSFFMIQPTVGYKVTEKFWTGLSPLYIYNSRNYISYTTGQKFSQSVNAYGPGIFARYFINDEIFANAEYLGLSYTIYNEANGQNISRFSNSAFVGGGYMPGGNSTGGMYFIVLYDLAYDQKTSFYGSPFDIRIGYIF